MLRVIDPYADCNRDCVSVKDVLGREREPPGRDSVVEGSFHDGMANMIDVRRVEELSAEQPDWQFNLLRTDCWGGDCAYWGLIVRDQQSPFKRKAPAPFAA